MGGDSAWTFGIGELAPNAQKLNDATAWILEQGIQAMQPGNRLTDVSHAIELATYEAEDKWDVELFIVDGFGGHGIGRTMHEDPFLPNEGKANRGPLIQEGSEMAIEPLITLALKITSLMLMMRDCLHRRWFVGSTLGAHRCCDG